MDTEARPGRPRKQPNGAGEWLCTKGNHWLPLSDFYVDLLEPDRPRHSWCKRHLRRSVNERNKRTKHARVVRLMTSLLDVDSLEEWQALSEEEQSARFLRLSTEDLARLALVSVGFMPAERLEKAS